MLQNLQQLILNIGDIIQILFPILIGVATLVFIFGVIKWMANANNDEERKKGTKIIIAGLIGLFVIVSAFGIVELVQDAFNVDNSNNIENSDVPRIPGL